MPKQVLWIYDQRKIIDIPDTRKSIGELPNGVAVTNQVTEPSSSSIAQRINALVAMVLKSIFVAKAREFLSDFRDGMIGTRESYLSRRTPSQPSRTSADSQPSKTSESKDYGSWVGAKKWLKGDQLIAYEDELKASTTSKDYGSWVGAKKWLKGDQLIAYEDELKASTTSIASASSKPRPVSWPLSSKDTRINQLQAQYPCQEKAIKELADFEEKYKRISSTLTPHEKKSATEQMSTLLNEIRATHKLNGTIPKTGVVAKAG